MIKFFKFEEEKFIIVVICKVESVILGEIRVYLEENLCLDVLMEVKWIFCRLQMYKIVDCNGVLILLVFEKKVFVIIGDEGIDKVVEGDFWEKECDLLQNYFKKGYFCVGIVVVIDLIGEKFKVYFLVEKDNLNELLDDIFYGVKDIQ